MRQFYATCHINEKTSIIRFFVFPRRVILKRENNRLLHGIYLKSMKGNWKITICDWLALKRPLGSRTIIHAQKSPWTLDVGHVDNLNDKIKLRNWLRFNWLNYNLIGITTRGCNVLKLGVELH